MIENNEMALKRDAHLLRIKAHATCGREDEVDHVGCPIVFICLCL